MLLLFDCCGLQCFGIKVSAFSKSEIASFSLLLCFKVWLKFCGLLTPYWVDTFHICSLYLSSKCIICIVPDSFFHPV